MAWWEKGLKSVREQTEKVAFEADKMMRIRHEEGAAGEIKAHVHSKLVDLGQAALELYRNGTLNNSSIAGVAAEIAAMEVTLQEQEAKIEGIKAEQYQAPSEEAPAETPAAVVPPQAPQPPATAAPLAESSAPASTPIAPDAPVLEEPLAESPVVPPAAPVPPVAPAPAAVPLTSVTCPNCGAEQLSTTKFCTECGTRLKP